MQSHRIHNHREPTLRTTAYLFSCLLLLGAWGVPGSVWAIPVPHPPLEPGDYLLSSLLSGPFTTTGGLNITNFSFTYSGTVPNFVVTNTTPGQSGITSSLEFTRVFNNPAVGVQSLFFQLRFEPQDAFPHEFEASHVGDASFVSQTNLQCVFFDGLAGCDFVRAPALISPTSAIDIPGTFALFLLGLLGLAVYQWRRERAYRKAAIQL